MLSVGTLWCSGFEAVARPGIQKGVLSDTLLRQAARERPELGNRLSDLMILEERSEYEQAPPEESNGASSNAQEPRSAHATGTPEQRRSAGSSGPR